MATIVALFRHSGDADLAAAHLLADLGLTEAQVAVVAPADVAETDMFAGQQAFAGLWATAAGAADGDAAIVRRWGGEVVHAGKTLVVARPGDTLDPYELAEALHRSGAEQIDIMME